MKRTLADTLGEGPALVWRLLRLEPLGKGVLPPGHPHGHHRLDLVLIRHREFGPGPVVIEPLHAAGDVAAQHSLRRQVFPRRAGIEGVGASRFAVVVESGPGEKHRQGRRFVRPAPVRFDELSEVERPVFADCQLCLYNFYKA